MTTSAESLLGLLYIEIPKRNNGKIRLNLVLSVDLHGAGFHPFVPVTPVSKFLLTVPRHLHTSPCTRSHTLCYPSHAPVLPVIIKPRRHYVLDRDKIFQRRLALGRDFLRGEGFIRGGAYRPARANNRHGT